MQSEQGKDAKDIEVNFRIAKVQGCDLVSVSEDEPGGEDVLHRVTAQGPGALLGLTQRLRGQNAKEQKN